MPRRKIFLLAALILAILIQTLALTSISKAEILDTGITKRFSDVPQGHRLEYEIHRLRDLNITLGIGNNQFGLGRLVTRGEFVTWLVRLMGWEIVKPDQGSFLDNMDPSHHFYGSIETALNHKVIQKDSEYFRTNDPITREEIAVMIVRTLGYDFLARKLNPKDNPFTDVTRNIGYMMMVRDLGITNGTSATTFSPERNATREEAAALIIRMYDKLNTSLKELHAFYAISSFSQVSKFSSLDSVSFGWARLEYDAATGQIIVNTDRTNNNEYAIPDGYDGVLADAQEKGISRQLMFFVRNQSVVDPETQKSIGLAEYIVTNPEARKQAILTMASLVNSTNKYGTQVSFDGLVSDFEGFKGDTLAQAYNTFLTELKAELSKTGKKLYVAVHPRGKPGMEYFDGYDYKTIGELADKVILMAHDYDAKYLDEALRQSLFTDTPLTPFDEIYYALKSITDPVTGVADRSKIWLQFSMGTAQWVQDMNLKAISNEESYKPSYADLYKRFQKGVTQEYSKLERNPYIIFFDEAGNRNIVWYENQQSIAEKIQLAKMFGIQGLSIWRLGNIPDYNDPKDAQFSLDIWGEILKNY